MRLVVVALALLLAGCVDEEVTDTVTVDLIPGEYWYEEFNIVEDGTPVDIAMEVLAGPRVNFYVIEPSQLDEYERGEPFEVVDGQRVDGLTHYRDIVTFDKAGIYYLLFDNFVDPVTPAEEETKLQYTLVYVAA